MGSISWLQVIILGIIPLGQLWARIVNFNGSLDKWWLMFPLFLIPPFSFVPLLLMKFGYIKNGKGGKPYDMWMLLPILAKLIIPYTLPFLIDEDSTMLFSLVSFILQLLTVMLGNLIRRQNNCKNITTDSIGKAGIDSTIAIGMGDLAAFGIPWIPLVGTFFSIIEMIPVIGNFIDPILWSVGFIGTYVLINMFNQDSMEAYCSTPFFGNTKDKIPFFISIGLIVVTKIFG